MRIKLRDGHILTLPDGSSEDEIQRRISQYEDSKRTTDVGESLGRGLYRGAAAIPNLFAGATGLLESLIPGKQESLEAVEGNLRKSAQTWEDMGPGGESDTFAEKVLEGIGRAPGEIATIAAFAPLGGLVPRTVAGVGAALARPALVFGAHGAVMHGGEGLRSAAAHGLRGAAEGAAFGATGRMAGGILPGVETAGANMLRRIGHGAGAGSVVGAAAALEGAPASDVAAAATTMGLIGMLSKPQKAGKTRQQILEDLQKEVREKVKSGEIKPEDAEQTFEAAVKEFVPAEPTEFVPPEQRKGVVIESDLEAAGLEARPFQDMTKAGQKFYDNIGVRRMLKKTQEEGSRVVRGNEDTHRRAATEVFTDAEGKPIAAPENIDALADFIETQTANAGITGQKLRRQIKRAKETNDPAYNDYMEQYESHLATMPAQLMQARAAESAIGNALRIIAVARRNTPAWLKAAKTLEKKGIFDGDLKFNKNVMELLELSDGHPELTARISKAFDTPSLWEYFQEYWINGLLSGFPTHVVNVTSNQALLGLDMVEKRTALGLEVKLEGLSKEIAKGEWDADWRGMAASIGPAFKTFKRMMKDEDYDITSDYPQWAALQRGRVKSEYRRKVIGGKLGQFTRLPTRALAAADMFNKIVAGERYANSTAYRIAATEASKGKITPDQIMARKTELLGLGEKTVDSRVLASMKDNAARLTYTEKPGPGMAKLFSALEGSVELPFIGEVKPGVLVAPFKSTPWNVIRQAVKRSPLNLINSKKLYKQYKNGDITPQQFYQEATATAIGTAATAALVGLAKAGYLTGGGPINPADRSNKIAQGWKPYAFKIPNDEGGYTYFSLQRLEPLGTILGMAGDIAEFGDVRPEDKFGKMTSAIKDNLANKTFLMGLENLAAFMHDPKQFGGWYYRQTIGSLVPTGVAKATQAIDPYARRVENTGFREGIPEALMYRLPFLSQELPQKSTVFGEPAERWSFMPTTLDSTAGKAVRSAGALLSPVVSGVQTERQAVEAEFTRLSNFKGMPPSMPRKSKTMVLRGTDGTDVKLTDDEFAIYDRYHQMAKERLGAMISAPNWESIPDNMKAAMLRKTYNKYRSAATKEVNVSIRRRTTVGN